MDEMKARIKYLREHEELPGIKEEKLMQTITASKQAWYEKEYKNTASYFEFLIQQAEYVKKRWWLCQAGVLLLLWERLFAAQRLAEVYREAGILIPVFVILIIPELWKNVRTRSVEIENCAFYTLRQVYCARLLLFGIVDLLLFSAFFAAASFTAQITWYDLIIQCMLPFNMTCGICFSILCSRRLCSEYMAIAFCMIGAAIWYQIVSNESLYASISEAVWLGLLILSVIYLCYVIHRLMKACLKYCEVDMTWN